MRCKNSGSIKCSLPCVIASEKNKSNFMFIKSVPGNTVEVLLWNHHLKENKLKRQCFSFQGIFTQNKLEDSTFLFAFSTTFALKRPEKICFISHVEK